MAEKKFNIGDHVVIKNSNVDWIENHAGHTGVVEEYRDTGDEYAYLIGVDNRPLLHIWCSVECLVSEKTPADKIVITHDGKTTVATLIHADGSKESATSNCAPEDKFDFYTGAKLALERLVKRANEIEVKGFKVGDRVRVGGLYGTIICITMGDMFGVQFDDEEFDGHRCGGIKLKAGSPARKSNCWWVNPCNAIHAK